MSASNALPNLQLFSNEDVVISPETLTDFVVVEVTAQRSTLQPQQFNESNDDASGINSLPDEIILQVFSHLTQNQLGQIARVCRKWSVLTKSPAFWRKVNVQIFWSSAKKQDAVAKSFINGLPSCVTFIRLDFSGPLYLDSMESCEYLDFEKLCMTLHQNCPHVEELILRCCGIPTILPEVINFCTQFLHNLKKLVIHSCWFKGYSRTVELKDNSKIEILDFYHCGISGFSKTHFSKLLSLKELRLNKTYVDDTLFADDTTSFNQLHVLDLGWTQVTLRIFLAIQRHGRNLEELYLCGICLGRRTINFNNLVFPHLKTICLHGSSVTCEVLVSFIRSCPSLVNVYVDEDVADSFAEHPLVVANICKSGIVKSIHWGHNHNVDYLHN